MSARGLALFSRSLIVRMALLSIVFLALALGWFALIRVGADVQRDPLTLTTSIAEVAVHDALNAQADGRGGEQEYASTLREIAVVNPRFRYYGRRGDAQVQFGDAPKWRHVLPAETALPSQENDSVSWQATLDEGGVRAHVHFRLVDGEATYVEISGIENAVELGLFDAFRPPVFWWASKNLLIVGAGVALVGILVLLLALRPLRALARTASSFTAARGRHVLSEQGLPSEVVPLIHAVNEMVGRLDNAREQQELFLAAAAHELRTPMTVLRTRLEELAEGDVKEALRKDLRRMSTLVDQLLRLMCIGNQNELSDDVDLVVAAREVVVEHAPLAVREGVDVELAAEVDALVLRGDQGLVKVALGNLLDNALSFSKAGDRLEVRVQSDASVAVRDRGPGIPNDDVERIFEPFAKSPPNRKGHGLGLAIVKAIMGLHGGTVSARNADDGGATFALRFRLAAP